MPPRQIKVLPTPKELTIARELVEGRSLVDFTNVLLNLSEFLYIE